MPRYFLAFALFLFSGNSYTQKIAVLSNRADALTRHSKPLYHQPVATLLKGQYYLKTDDNTFISTDGTETGTRKLKGFVDVKSIVSWTATNNFLYYQSTFDGSAHLFRYDPETGQHKELQTNKGNYKEKFQTHINLSGLKNHLGISTWSLGENNSSNTFTFAYGVKDSDSVPYMYPIGASVNEKGITYTSLGYTGNKMIGIYDINKAGQDASLQIYSYVLNDTFKTYLLKNNFDFESRGYRLSGHPMQLGDEVLFILAKKEQLAAKSDDALRLWSLRDNNIRYVGSFFGVKSSGVSERFVVGDKMFFLFDDGLYSYDQTVEQLTNHFKLQSGEGLAATSHNDRLMSWDNYIFFVKIKPVPGQPDKRELLLLDLNTSGVTALPGKLPDRFQNQPRFFQTAVNYFYGLGKYIYYFDELTATTGQLIQHSIVDGTSKKIAFPAENNETYIGVSWIEKAGNCFIIRADYSNAAGQKFTKTILYSH